MDIDDLKRDLQGHLADGVVTVVGSGLSVAEGIPGMGKLATTLQAEMPAKVAGADLTLWQAVDAALQAGAGLEAALLANAPSEAVEDGIIEVTTDLLLGAETQVIDEAISGTRTLRISRLLPHLIPHSAGTPVITTNYERLVEVGAELAGLQVDTLFVGDHAARLDAKESAYSFCRGAQIRGGRSIRFNYQPRVKVLKPHGSFDWYLKDGKPVRSPHALGLKRLIITPGLNKFRAGYEQPFDIHREHGNRAIDKAARFLLLGYGFNDGHLETHLAPRLEAGAPALVLTRSLSPNGQKLLANCPSMTVLCRPDGGSDPSTRVMRAGSDDVISGVELWDVNGFVSEVLEP